MCYASKQMISILFILKMFFSGECCKNTPKKYSKTKLTVFTTKKKGGGGFSSINWEQWFGSKLNPIHHVLQGAQCKATNSDSNVHSAPKLSK